MSIAVRTAQNLPQFIRFEFLHWEIVEQRDVSSMDEAAGVLSDPSLCVVTAQDYG